MRASVAKVKTVESKLKVAAQELRDAETQLAASKKLVEKLEEVKELQGRAKVQAVLLTEREDEASQRSEEALLHSKAAKLAQEQAKLAQQRKHEAGKTLAHVEAQERAATKVALRLCRACARGAGDGTDDSDDDGFIRSDPEESDIFN